MIIGEVQAQPVGDLLRAPRPRPSGRRPEKPCCSRRRLRPCRRRPRHRAGLQSRSSNFMVMVERAPTTMPFPPLILTVVLAGPRSVRIQMFEPGPPAAPRHGLRQWPEAGPSAECVALGGLVGLLELSIGVLVRAEAAADEFLQTAVGIRHSAVRRLSSRCSRACDNCGDDERNRVHPSLPDCSLGCGVLIRRCARRVKSLSKYH